MRAFVDSERFVIEPVQIVHSSQSSPPLDTSHSSLDYPPELAVLDNVVDLTIRDCDVSHHLHPAELLLRPGDLLLYGVTRDIRYLLQLSQRGHHTESGTIQLPPSRLTLNPPGHLQTRRSHKEPEADHQQLRYKN